MDKKVNQKIIEARSLLSIDGYPGFLYDYLNEKKELLMQNKIFLFKEDIDKLSGFIGYHQDATIICINYKRPIGHQNMTLAHELGHYFLHYGINNSDDNDSINQNRKDGIESEAFQFASELLYPKEMFDEDFRLYDVKNLIDQNEYLKVAQIVNELCHKYYLSFAMVLRMCMFKSYRTKEYKLFKGHIDKEVGSIGEFFDRDFYIANESLAVYQQDLTCYLQLKENIQVAKVQRKISDAVGESILDNYDMLEVL
jgi:Zn-dependent peptidase ImmA (M78 family)